ncbi:MAG TPA: hypothetical protein VGB59_11985 [Allosphingosinicella sp.]|jgi:hypothetical protein
MEKAIVELVCEELESVSGGTDTSGTTSPPPEERGGKYILAGG